MYASHPSAVKSLRMVVLLVLFFHSMYHFLARTSSEYSPTFSWRLTHTSRRASTLVERSWLSVVSCCRKISMREGSQSIVESICCRASCGAVVMMFGPVGGVRSELGRAVVVVGVSLLFILRRS